MTYLYSQYLDKEFLAHRSRLTGYDPPDIEKFVMNFEIYGIAHEKIILVTYRYDQTMKMYVIFKKQVMAEIVSDNKIHTTAIRYVRNVIITTCAYTNPCIAMEYSKKGQKISDAVGSIAVQSILLGYSFNTSARLERIAALEIRAGSSLQSKSGSDDYAKIGANRYIGSRRREVQDIAFCLYKGEGICDAINKRRKFGSDSIPDPKKRAAGEKKNEEKKPEPEHEGPAKKPKPGGEKKDGKKLGTKDLARSEIEAVTMFKSEYKGTLDNLDAVMDEADSSIVSKASSKLYDADKKQRIRYKNSDPKKQVKAIMYGTDKNAVSLRTAVHAEMMKDKSYVSHYKKNLELAEKINGKNADINASVKDFSRGLREGELTAMASGKPLKRHAGSYGFTCFAASSYGSSKYESAIRIKAKGDDVRNHKSVRHVVYGPQPENFYGWDEDEMNQDLPLQTSDVGETRLPLGTVYGPKGIGISEIHVQNPTSNKVDMNAVCDAAKKLGAKLYIEGA